MLIEECRRRTPGYPYAGKALALLARVVLQHAPTSVYAVELYALALARLANAIRVIGDLPRADQVLSDARYFLRTQSGGGDRLVRAEIDSLEGSLRIGQERSPEAISLLLRALMAYRLEGESEAETACLIKLGRAHGKQGDLERAMSLCREASRHPGIQGDRRLDRLSRRNLAFYLALSDRIDEARAAQAEVLRIFHDPDDPVEHLRFSWTEAMIELRACKRETAEDLMLSVRSGFAAHELRYDDALAGLELAGWYAEDGRRCEAEPLLDEALPIFQSLDLPRKTAAVHALRVRLSAPSSVARAAPKGGCGS